MNFLPESLRSLVQQLAKLPGVGERTALRYAVSLLRGGPRRFEELGRALEAVALEVSDCPTCGFWADAGHCPLCEDSQRPATRLCVVRDSPDVLALEKFRPHPWRYHVLHGLLSPLSGVGPEQIRLNSLFDRARDSDVTEIILALDSTVEGDATALYIRDQARTQMPGVKLTKTAMGLPAGASVEYLDASTLENALAHRLDFE